MKEIYSKIGIVFLMGVILTVALWGGLHQVKEVPKKVVPVKQETPKVEKKAATVAVTMAGTVHTIELEEYLVGVVAGEMPVSFELEALKAQVVASRTFVYSRSLQVDNTTNTQVYLTDEQMKKNWQDKYEEKKAKIEQAIAQTKGQVMKYNGEYISALFFSSSNGYTENSEDYFIGGSIPYLKSVPCSWDLQIDPRVKRDKTFTKEQLQEKFSCKNLDFSITSYKKSGRVQTLIVDKKEYTGRQVRELLGLASSCFTIDVKDNQYVFTTLGSGHGVGMSQYGAQGMALEGKKYDEILKYFYTGIEIVNN